MRMYDIITTKKHGGALTAAEIRFAADGFLHDEIPDYQMSALLMAVCLRGMDAAETAALTLALAESGDRVDLSGIPGVKVDKHSTGGVGDKTTLIVSPIVASCGVPVAKMSGRGLGHTGGTVDKLEAIPGMRMSLSQNEFLSIVRQTGLCVAGQSGDLTPADKKIYALRDATATVDSIPLIAASIMSKKIAAGADKILLDVKTGSGAFMKSIEDARVLAEVMVQLGEAAGRETVAFVTDMDAPLGRCIGNALELQEVVDVLHGEGPEDLTEICLVLAAEMLMLAGKGGADECRRLAEEAITSGRALVKLGDMVAAQGGDRRYAEDTSLFPSAAYRRDVIMPDGGYLTALDAEACGAASCVLGAGRLTYSQAIDHAAGIVLHAKPGDLVEKGAVLATLHTNNPAALADAEARLLAACSFGKKPPVPRPLIAGRYPAAPRSS